MFKKSYIVQMTYDVSDAEKAEAEKAILAFNHTLKQLKIAADHLNIMLTPFKDHPDIGPDQVFKFRVQIRKFRDQAIDNFNNFKISAFRCIVVMQKFQTDTQTSKLMKAFIASIDDLETKVNDFAEEFQDLKSNEFSKNVVKFITDIQDKCEEIEEIVNDRLKAHIRENILSKTWVDDISTELDTKIEQSKPLIMELFNQRQEDLNNKLK